MKIKSTYVNIKTAITVVALNKKQITISIVSKNAFF